MIGQVLQRLADIERRLSNVLLMGVIVDADYERALVKVAAGTLETGWLCWITTRAGNDIDYWAPEIGEQVMVMSPTGDVERGVVMPAIYQNKFPATDQRETLRRIRFSDGADFSYDREANKLNISLPQGATTALVSEGGVEITGATTINGETTVNGTLHVTGNISAGENVIDSTRSMKDDRLIYNDHVHSPSDKKPTSKQ